VRDEAAFAKAGQGLLEASNRRDVARARLFILIAEPRASNTTLQSPPEPSPPPTALEPALERALATRPEMLAAGFAVDASKARVELAEAQDNPSLHFQTDFISRTANAIQPGNSWQAGVYFSLPLFDGGVSEAKANQAREVVVQLEAIRDNLKRQVSLEVESLYLDLVSRWQRVDVARKEAAAAEEAARVARLRYLEGISSNVERLDAESALTSAQLDLAGARYQYLAGLARWRRAVP
jgi:outer membrane protein TolC